MIINKGIFVFLLISFLVIKWTKSDNTENTKLKDALQNNTSTNLKNQSDNNEEKNIFKAEAKKMLKQCGVESNESQDMDGFGTRNNKNSFDRNGGSSFYVRRSNKNNYRNNYRPENYDNSNNDGDWNMYGNPSWNNNNRQNQPGNKNFNSYQGGPDNNSRRQGHDQSIDSNGDSIQNDRYGFYGNYGSSSNRNSNNGGESDYNNSNNQNGYGGQNNNRYGYDNQNTNNPNQYGDQNYGYGNSNYGQSSFQGNRHSNADRSYQSSDSNNKNSYSPYDSYNGGNIRNSGCDEGSRTGLGYLGGGSFGFTRQLHRSRSQRSNTYFNKDKNEQIDDNQCISQCVFGYLQLLDNDRTPSESMIIKWLQDHVKGTDMDRIKTLRDARRCFARLSTTDTEDGCDFSKELASCLDLDLE